VSLLSDGIDSWARFRPRPVVCCPLLYKELTPTSLLLEMFHTAAVNLYSAANMTSPFRTNWWTWN